MGLFKKRYSKNVTRDNEFMKEYAIKVNGLLLYTEDNEKVTKELKVMQNDLQYTVASSESSAKGVERKIKKEFSALVDTLEKPAWDEAVVLAHIKNIRRYTIEIGAMR